MNIIQIGANDGEDSVYDYILKNNDKLNKVVIVEPVPLLIPELTKRYSVISNVTVENIGIVGSESTENLDFYYERDSNYECSSFNKNHLPSLGCKPENICVIKVPVMTFDQLMIKHGLTHLDDLFIDAEGYDYQILKSIDFKKYKINTITFEVSHMDGTGNRGENAETTKEMLMKNGYVVMNSGENCVANLIIS